MPPFEAYPETEVSSKISSQSPTQESGYEQNAPPNTVKTNRRSFRARMRDIGFHRAQPDCDPPHTARYTVNTRDI